MSWNHNRMMAMFTPPVPQNSLRLWLDASRLVGLSNDDPVTNWQDLSPSGFNAAQDVEISKPLYKTAVQNGLPGVYFDGVDDFMTFGNVMRYPLPISVFVVLEHIPTQYGAIFANNKTTTRHSGVWMEINYSKPSMSFGNNTGIAGSSRRTGGAVSNIDNAPSSLYFGVFGATDMVIARNGINQDLTYSGTGGDIAYGDRPATLGSNAGIAFFKGHMHEFLLYDRQLGTEEITAINDYLMSKWGIT